MKENTFTEKLTIGKRFEIEIANLFPGSVISTGYFPGFDILLKSGKTVETKYNRAAQQYGSVFVEMRCSGKPSGLSTTKADYQIIGGWFGDHSRVWSIQTETLQVLLSGSNVRYSCGGDDKQTEGYVVPISLLGGWASSSFRP